MNYQIIGKKTINRKIIKIFIVNLIGKIIICLKYKNKILI